ncbi:unnamed protein product [[Candida] boidinii]|nr:unnamed protein product [[Candida] boidinii]
MEISDQENKFDCISYYLDEIFNFINEQQREARKSVVNLDKDKNLLKILINHKDNKGNTALHLAANNNNRFFMKKLLLNGADYHLKNNLGESAKNKIPVTLILEAKEQEKENELKLLQEQQQQQQLAQLQQQQQQQQLAQLQQQQHVQLHAQQEVQLQAQLQAQLHAQQQAQIQAQFQAVAQAQMRDQLQAAVQLQSDFSIHLWI